jgi:hypothetical protein
MNNFASIFEELSKLYEEDTQEVKNVGSLESELDRLLHLSIRRNGNTTALVYETPDYSNLARVRNWATGTKSKTTLIDAGSEDSQSIAQLESMSTDILIIDNFNRANPDIAEDIYHAYFSARLAIAIIAANGATLNKSLINGADLVYRDNIDEALTESAEDEVVEVVEDEFVGDEIPAEEVPAEEPVVEDEPRQLICECDKCGALVIKDEADIVVDEETDLVNVEDECQFCEEAKGFKIVGVVAPYDVVDVKEEAEEVVEEEAPIEEAADPILDKLSQELVKAGYDANLFTLAKGKTDGYALDFDEETYDDKKLVADLKSVIDKLGYTARVNFMGDRIEVTQFAIKESLTEAADPILDKIQQELVNAKYDTALFMLERNKLGGYTISFDEETYGGQKLVADVKNILAKLNFTGNVNFLGDRVEITNLTAKGA